MSYAEANPDIACNQNNKSLKALILRSRQKCERRIFCNVSEAGAKIFQYRFRDNNGVIFCIMVRPSRTGIITVRTRVSEAAASLKRNMPSV